MRRTSTVGVVVLLAAGCSNRSVTHAPDAGGGGATDDLGNGGASTIRPAPSSTARSAPIARRLAAIVVA